MQWYRLFRKRVIRSAKNMAIVSLVAIGIACVLLALARSPSEPTSWWFTPIHIEIKNNTSSGRNDSTWDTPSYQPQYQPQTNSGWNQDSSNDSKDSYTQPQRRVVIQKPSVSDDSDSWGGSSSYSSSDDGGGYSSGSSYSSSDGGGYSDSSSSSDSGGYSSDSSSDSGSLSDDGGGW